MSQATSTPEPTRAVFFPKQSANIYTMMLILTFIAIVIGCLFLYLEMKSYDMSIKVSGDAKVPPAPVAPAPEPAPEPAAEAPAGTPPPAATTPEGGGGAFNFQLPAPLANWQPRTFNPFNSVI